MNNLIYQTVVTGHSGFIGEAVAQVLTANDIFWTGVSRSTGFDLLDSKAKATLPKSDWIVHLAGKVGVLNSWENPHELYKSNHDMTLTVLENARRTNASVLYVSSYMYGIPQYLPIDENHPVSCNNPYANSKRIGEQLCEAYAKDFDINVIILRPFNVFGIHQEPFQLLPHIVGQAGNDQTIKVADLAPKRDWLWVNDLADAIFSIISAPPKSFEIYNVGYGTSFSVQQILGIVVERFDNCKVESQNEIRRNEIPDCVCDSQKFMKDYGWSANTSLESGINKMVDYYFIQANSKVKS